LQLLAWGTDPEAPYDRQRAECARELAWEVVAHDFDHLEAKAARAAWAAEKRLAAGFYALSVERWGRRVECAALAADGLPGMEMPHLDFTDTADQFLRAIKLLQGAGADAGKTIRRAMSRAEGWRWSCVTYPFDTAQ
jgi:hypothetical protein